MGSGAAILLLLFGVWVVFMLVRTVKYAWRTVDEEQKCNQQVLTGSIAFSLPEPTLISRPEVTEPKVIRFGMTPEEVESALGTPQTKVDLGAKILYRYEGITLEFSAGKLIDAR